MSMVSGLRPDVDQLINAYRSYAHAIASEMLRKLPPHIERDDIIGAAELGLVEAARAFDPNRGVLFKTFAFYRIRGAVYDGLRKMAWFSKAQYQQYRFERAANEYLSDYSSTAVPQGTPEEDCDDLKDIAGSIVSCYMLSLDQFPQEIATGEGAQGEDECEKLEQQQLLRQCLAELPERNRQVMNFNYLQDLSMEEIGEKLGLSKSWVCRIHSKSLEMLRNALQGDIGRERSAIP
jgi:RNA polymerase sigma factor for flagellar operon FliA